MYWLSYKENDSRRLYALLSVATGGNRRYRLQVSIKSKLQPANYCCCVALRQQLRQYVYISTGSQATSLCYSHVRYSLTQHSDTCVLVIVIH